MITRHKKPVFWILAGEQLGYRVLSLGLALGFSLSVNLSSTALSQPGSTSPLKGSAIITQPSEPAYIPRNRTIRHADQLAQDYKLQAAEAIYKELLKHNSRNAAGWNGLGKIAYYQTASSNQIYRAQKDALLQNAIQHFMTALRYQPNYVEARLNLASVYMAQGRMGEADEQISKAVHLAPKNPEVLARKGEWLVRNQEYNAAVPILKEALQRQSSNVSAQYYLAEAHWARHEAADALQRLNTVLGLQPRHAQAHYTMGKIYQHQGNGSAAITAYHNALSLNPELNAARHRLADLYESRGDYTNALAQLQTLIESGQGDWTLTQRAAELALRKQQPQLAVQLYRHWADQNPDRAEQAQHALSEAKLHVARQHQQSPDLASQGESQRYATQALQFNPNNMQARLIEARFNREIGQQQIPQTGEDPHFIDVALQTTTTHPHQSLHKGDMLLARYRFAQADEAYRNARRGAGSGKQHMVFGELFLTKGLPHLAEEAFQQVLTQHPDNDSARLGLAKAQQAQQKSATLVAEARLHERQKQTDIAFQKLQEALQHDMRNAQAHYWLAVLHERHKQYADAADRYFAYLALSPGSEDAIRIQRRIESLKHKLAKASASR